MPKASPIQNAFNAGEVSPLFEARVDHAKRKNAVAVLENYYPVPQGPVIRRPGTRYVASVKTPANRTAIIPFEFSTTQAYIIEVGDEYFRFYKDGGQILDGGPYEITTPYAQADLFDADGRLRLKFAQSADILYLAHPDYPPQKLSRTGHTAWTLTEIDFQDGPWASVNNSFTNQLKLAGVAGTNIVLDSVESIWVAGDVGRQIRYKGATTGTATPIFTNVTQADPAVCTTTSSHTLNPGDEILVTSVGGMVELNQRRFNVGAVTSTTFELDGEDSTGHTAYTSSGGAELIVEGDWTWLEITSYETALRVRVTIRGARLQEASVTTPYWRWWLWDTAGDYPATVTFYEDRLFWGGAPEYPQRIDGSRTGDYENMAPTDPDGVVADDHALSVTLNARKVNVVRWLADDENGLLIGTAGGEWVLRPSTLGEALSPTNRAAKRPTSYGSTISAPVRVGPATLFVQRAGRKLRELAYNVTANGFQAPDMTLLAEHITSPLLLDLEYQQEPHGIIWGVRSDGVLLGFSYNREEDVTGWHRHILGGVSDASDTPAAVESIAVIPAWTGGRDHLWLVVKRYIDGATVRTVEYMEAEWTEGSDLEDAFYVDSGLTYDSTPATIISGLDHLEGETVAILTDGAVHPTKEVTGGEITLDYSASVVQIGLGYTSVLETLRIEAGAADGTSQGKIKRITRVVVRFLQTIGAWAGPPDDVLELSFRDADDPMDSPPPIFDGDREINWPSGYDTEGVVRIEQRDPLPSTIVAIMPQVTTQDR